MRTPVADIDPGVSSYLDVLRIVAATTVLVSHYLPPLFGTDAELIPGHDAVILFFVMSGYVIAYVSQERDRPLERFVIHRLARLWSVLVPSLAVSALAAILVGKEIVIDAAPAISAPVAFTSAALRSVLFLGENWIAYTPCPYNYPAWSLHYEAWYYAIFAAFAFSPLHRRWVVATIVAVLAGPVILALFPCWIIGAWIYYRRKELLLGSRTAYALFAGCLLLYGVAYHFDLTTQSRHWLAALTAGQSYHLRSSTAVIGDTLLAPIVAASIIAVRSMPAVNAALVRARRISRLAASRTLSLYLFHMPLLALLYGWVGLGRHGGFGAVLCLAIGFGGCLLLGSVSEARLVGWRRGLRAVYVLIRGWSLMPSSRAER